MKVLGIESSCDETAVAVVDDAGRVWADQIHSQIATHADYGGVVPELASRAHIQHIAPLVARALDEAGLAPEELDGVAAASGPGLVGALLVGLSFAKGLAMAAGVPFIGVHHMEGHLMSPFLNLGPGEKTEIDYPFMALLVSGGHTQLMNVKAFGDYELVGQTLDDAVGEAFDKGAKMLGLGYPGGPAVAKLAEGGNGSAVAFPRALRDKKRLDFSFSGLKTALRTYLLEAGEEAHKRDIAASYQEAIVDALVTKSLLACGKTGSRRLVVAGGVGANRRLREELARRGGEAGIDAYFPPLKYCTDNGAMVALAGLKRLQRGERSGWELNARPTWPLSEMGREGHG